MKYELIEHTADIGIRIKAGDLKELFGDAALAMFDIIAKRIQGSGSRPQEVVIKLEADNVEELFINWLNELLSLSATKELIFTDFKINKLDNNNLEAIASGDDVSGYKVNVEIKAATYHQLKIEQTKDACEAELIFDV